jgi:hypothetical protein
MKDRFDLEQEIMGCWGITDDLQHLLEHIDKGNFDSLSPSDTDELANIVMGLRHIYEMKFTRLFDTFSDCIPELESPSDNRLNDVTPKEWDQVSKILYSEVK